MSHYPLLKPIIIVEIVPACPSLEIVSVEILII